MTDPSRSPRNSLGRGSFSPNGSDAGRTLPEDDGMGPLRRRILEIQKLDTPNAEKSRQIHLLMTEQYSSSHHSSVLRSLSPSSWQSQERPITPTSRQSNEHFVTESPNTILSAEEELYTTEEEKKPSYYVPKAGIDHTELEEKRFGCPHYMRNVKLQCSACYRWYTCRFCHDQVEDHCLNRRATRNMLCMACGSAQSASQECTSCGSPAAWYFCKICKLWDDDMTKSIYHCDDCGICRRGEGLGKDYFHCKTCCACISTRIKDTHKCIERSTDSDCPICGEYMFSSPNTVIFMRCGHSIHHVCWKEHMRNSFKCPICSKSMINMEITFRQFDLDIESQPMPPQFHDTKAWIYCNDCSAKSLVRYHWIGLKCIVCDSYNTSRLQVVSSPNSVNILEHEEALEPLAASLRDSTLLTRNQIRATPIPALDPQRHQSQLYRDMQAISPPSVEQALPPHYSSSIEAAAMDASDEEVDFWGGESPYERNLRALEEDEDSTDEQTSSEEEEYADDGLEEDDDEEDQMEIFGHR